METISQLVNSNLQSFEIINSPSETEQQNNSNYNRSTIDWEGYRAYLTNLNKSNREIQNKLGYGKAYCYILESGNAKDLMKVSNGCRVHAMRALSTLSKYSGQYEEWMKIVKRYQLKWKNEKYNSLNTFKNIFGIEEGSEQSLPQMMEWIKTSISKLSKEVSNILALDRKSVV